MTKYRKCDAFRFRCCWAVILFELFSCWSEVGYCDVEF